MYRGTPEEGGIAPGVEAVGDVFGVLRGGCIEGRQRKVALVRDGCCWDFVRRMYRGTPEEGGIAPGVEAVGDVFGVLRGGCIEGRQRKVASLRAGTPSGDTTRAP